MRKALAALALGLLALAGPPALAADSTPREKPECAALTADPFADLKEVVKAGCTPSPAQIARLLDNPVGNFIAVPFQFDAVEIEEPRTGTTKSLERFQVVPMFPIRLGSDWNLINRAVFPWMSVPVNRAFGSCVGYTPESLVTCPGFPEALADPFEPTGGFGDLVYVALASPAKPARVKSTGGSFIWGVGVTSMFPTASAEVLGTGRFSLGPAAVAGYLGKKWSLGLLAQQWWSAGGDSSRGDVSTTNVQYFVFYTPPWGGKGEWRIGMSPNVSVNWEAKGDKVVFPVGLGLSKMVSAGKLPVRLLLEVDYSVVHPSDRPASRWDLRFYVIPVIPTFLF